MLPLIALSLFLWIKLRLHCIAQTSPNCEKSFLLLLQVRSVPAVLDNDCLCFHVFFPPLTGRWYIREGWLTVVPPKGADTTPRMFFLFSDMLLQAKLQLTSRDKFAGQHAYPLQGCSVEKVFGHTRSQGGLLSVSVRPVVVM